jgi:hypothetical protein
MATPFQFVSSKYGPQVGALLERPRLASLGPGTPVTAVRPQLAALKLPPICLAGLWLYFDYLDESHTISQDDESDPDRNFWHAIMHRREPDAWNSKYWWRQVGNHPVLGQLREHSPALGYTFTTPDAFVDQCEKVRGSGNEEEEVAKRVQLLEWQFLFDWCWRKAAAG